MGIFSSDEEPCWSDVYNLQEHNRKYELKIDKLKAENDKLKTCLREIKAIAEELLEKGLEPQSVEHQLRLRGKRELASIILELTTKAEVE